jgi:hypothetical protein
MQNGKNSVYRPTIQCEYLKFAEFDRYQNVEEVISKNYTNSNRIIAWLNMVILYLHVILQVC